MTPRRWRQNFRDMNSDEYLKELVDVCRTNAMVRETLSHRGREIVNSYLLQRGEAPLFAVQTTQALVDQFLADCDLHWYGDHPKQEG